MTGPGEVSADAVRLPGPADGPHEGQAVRFTLTLDGVSRDGFVLRWRGTLRAYVNTCRHLSLPLDAGSSRFLDADGEALVCVHHGARYRPDTGECIAGPCRGARLTRLALERRADGTWCTGRAPDSGAPQV